MTHPFSEKEDNGGKGQITGTTWMVDFGPYKNTEKKRCKSNGI
jgi:hypothetical protein